MDVGWAIDSVQETTLVINALNMAVTDRQPASGGVLHSDRGSQFTSWAFTQKLAEAGLAPSMGSVGSAHDNAMMESFWARMQVELLNRRRWKARILWRIQSTTTSKITTRSEDTALWGCSPLRSLRINTCQ